ncbi:hypothetical protein ACJX0J_039832, partial [Zea mays]
MIHALRECGKTILLHMIFMLTICSIQSNINIKVKCIALFMQYQHKVMIFDAYIPTILYIGTILFYNTEFSKTIVIILQGMEEIRSIFKKTLVCLNALERYLCYFTCEQIQTFLHSIFCHIFNKSGSYKSVMLLLITISNIFSTYNQINSAVASTIDFITSTIAIRESTESDMYLKYAKGPKFLTA